MFSAIKTLFSNIGTLISLLQLIPTISDLVHQVEAPGVPGATKKNAVLTLLADTLNFATGTLHLKLPTTTIMAWANGIIDTLVNILNNFGTLLPHGTTATTAPVAVATAQSVKPSVIIVDTAGVIPQAPPNPMNVAD
jgi:hypothetical protein